jgi:small redox-active disulfide protein 2
MADRRKLIVLGPGCARCENLARVTGQAAEELGLDYHLEKLTDIKQFAGFGLMMTPGLVVDGKLVVQGKVPSVAEVKTMLGGGES